MQLLDRIFGLEEDWTSVRVEVGAGVVNFLILSYLLFVIPQIIVSAVAGNRGALLHAIPAPVKVATMSGIGWLPRADRIFSADPVGRSVGLR